MCKQRGNMNWDSFGGYEFSYTCRFTDFPLGHKSCTSKNQNPTYTLIIKKEKELQWYKRVKKYLVYTCCHPWIYRNIPVRIVVCVGMGWSTRMFVFITYNWSVPWLKSCEESKNKLSKSKSMENAILFLTNIFFFF